MPEPIANAGSVQRLVPSPGTCIACGSASRELRFAGERGPVHRCTVCGLYAVTEPIAPEGQAARFYETIDESSYTSYFEDMRKAHYRRVLGEAGIARGSSLLDVGASYGWMVEVALELGFDAHGIEPGEAQVDPAIAARIERTTLESFDPHGRRFGVVTIWHALEHLRDPASALRKMSTLLEPNGRLIIAIPNAEGRMYRLAELLGRSVGYQRLLSELYYFHNPNMHYWYFGPQALERLVERCGMKCERVFTMEAFDWRTIHRRGATPAMRAALRAFGPVVAASRFTARENLIAIVSR
jgi:2-polyprenyl-3-methyl-5-hydroxy-6-metoxy-1,4-benzoquinol methylase